MANTDPAAAFRRLSRLEQAVLAAGILAFIFSFLPWYGVTIGPFSASVNAWHSYSTLAVLLVLAATILAAIPVVAASNLSQLPIAVPWLVAFLSALGALLELIRLLTLHHGDGVGIRWGGYLLVIAMIVQAICAALAARASGQAAPWQTRGAPAPPPPPV